MAWLQRKCAVTRTNCVRPYTGVTQTTSYIEVGAAFKVIAAEESDTKFFCCITFQEVKCSSV